MKKVRKVLHINKVVANLIATVGLAVAIKTSQQFCVYIFHQPKMPKEIFRLRKF